jgi:AAHS family 4-hydroxybenzoate transporter-like MFS transporter
MQTDRAESRQPPLNVTALIDRERFSPFQLFVTVLCAVVAVLDGYDTQAIGFVAPVIAAEWKIPVATFGPVFGAGLFGLTIGALAFGPAADRFGRKAMILVSTALFGGFAFLTAFADSFQELLLFRFLTGIGLGGVMPNIITLTSEYAPARLRATMVSVMFCGFPVGAILGGILCAKMIPTFGWISVFYVGGLSALVLVPVLVVFLPESIRFVVTKNARDPVIASILRKIDPSLVLAPNQSFLLAEEKLHGLSVIHLFREGRAVCTLLLWVVFFMNLLILYFLSNWLPAVLEKSGLPIERAIIATVLLYVGGMLGGVLLARLIDARGPYGILAGSYAGAAVFIALIGSIGTSLMLVMTIVFFAGFCVIGAQLSINALASTTYPTSVRSTGVGWALGVGRIGSIIGPVLGGILMTIGLGTANLFLISAVPAVVAAVCVFLLKYVTRSESPAASVPEASWS